MNNKNCDSISQNQKNIDFGKYFCYTNIEVNRNRSTTTPLSKLKKSWDNRCEKQSQKVRWTELHFLRKESEWLHERDYGN